MKAWNLEQGDGKRRGASFHLDQDEYAIIQTHLICPGDCIYVTEVDWQACEEQVFVNLANDPETCSPMVLTHENKKVFVSGPGVFRVERRVNEQEEIEAQHVVVNVNKYKLKPGQTMLWNKGFACGAM